MGYPIVKLDGTGFGPKRDIQAYLRRLEWVLMRVLDQLGLEGSRVKNATGLWVGEKKVASIGIAVRKWVTYHGFALNVLNDLSPFQQFSPCGFNPDVMTNLKELQCDQVQSWGSQWRMELEKIFQKVFLLPEVSQQVE